MGVGKGHAGHPETNAVTVARAAAHQPAMRMQVINLNLITDCTAAWPHGLADPRF